MAVRVLNSEALNYAAYCELQRGAYAEILTNTKVSADYMSPAYFQWKYRNPYGLARIAIVEEGSRMIAANAMVPFRVVCNRTVVTAWQSCDTATARDHRGKGYFSACLKALTQELKPDELFFGYPNQNSMKGFLKMGWKGVHLIPTWVGVSFMGSWDHRILALSEFESSHDPFARAMADTHGVMIERAAAYLNWRYTQHPIYKYSLFAYVEKGAYQGYMVLRAADVLNHKVALIMEGIGQTASVTRLLLLGAAAWAKRQGLRYVVTLNSALKWGQALQARFLFVPSWMLPKKQLLMGYAKEPNIGHLLQKRWQAHLGDWDVF